jgi:urease accessory protein
LALRAALAIKRLQQRFAMLHARSVRRKAAVKVDKVVDTVTLDAEGRYRRRVTLTSDGGKEFLLDLAQATWLADGDALMLDGGGLIQVKAAPEKLLEVTAASPHRLLRIAWHVGNRHTPAEITPDAIYIADDHVLAEMVRGLGASVASVTRPFNPEGGAYGGHGAAHGAGHGHGQGHDHHHHHERAHDHGHDHHGHAHHHDHHHDHGPGCGHDHDHSTHDEHGHGRK